MSVSNRANTITSLHKVLSKHFKPVPAVERSLLELLLYACFLEDSKPEVADECFARMQESFFDWNEVRVTTVRELTELMRGLIDPARTATQLKQTLHSIFEALYNYDLEPLKKQNLGVSVKQLQQYRGTSPFMVSYVVQHGLGGHQIPVSTAALDVMYAVGAVDDSELATGEVPGLERAIAKSKGHEFASLLQQFAADFAASPNSTHVKNLLTEIDPDYKARLSRRSAIKAQAEAAAAAAKLAAEAEQAERARLEKAAADKAAEKGRKDKSSKETKEAKEAREAKEKDKDAVQVDGSKKKEPDKRKESDKKKDTDKSAMELDKKAPEKASEKTDAKLDEKLKDKGKEKAKERDRADEKPRAEEKKSEEKKGDEKRPKEKPVAEKNSDAREKEKDEKEKKASSSLNKAAKKSAPKKPAPAADHAKKKPAKKGGDAKKPPKTMIKKAEPGGKKSTSKQLARRKPR